MSKMFKFTVASVDAAVHKQPPGYKQDLIDHAEKVEDGFLYMKLAEVEKMDLKYNNGRQVSRHLSMRPQNRIVVPRPGIKAPDNGVSRGIGDSAKKAFGRMGIKQKKDCGCKKRQNKWNKVIPYSRGLAKTLSRIGL